MNGQAKYVQTPLMKQYYSIKAVHPDAILLFRVGDFYETFGDDAIKSSSILGITLTRRANGAASFVELAGFPHHALDTYLPKLVRAGQRVAICEQLEDPKTVKTIVKRGVTELVTPGTALNDNVLASKSNNFLAAVSFGKSSTGAAFLDLSTGEFLAAEGNNDYIDKLMANLSPKEILFSRDSEGLFKATFGTKHYTYRLDEWVFARDANRERLCKHFGTKSLKGYGIDSMDNAVSAAGAVLYYLEFTEHKDVRHISSISRLDEDKYVWVDRYTARNLELFSTGSGSSRGGFAETVDRTSSPMGARLLRRWISLPIKDIVQINRRADVVEAMHGDTQLCAGASAEISAVGDMERILARVASFRAAPREVVQLASGLRAVGRLRGVLEGVGSEVLSDQASGLDTCDAVCSRIEHDIFPDPSNQLVKGGVIAQGVDMELDDLRRIARGGKEVIAMIQQRESEITGIPSLKVSFNSVFGYYIEVRNTHKDKVPEGWIRKQTVKDAERYITAELKEYEEKILGAEEKIIAIETKLYGQLIAFLCDNLRPMQRTAAAVAEIDCLLSFARMAAQRNYCRPELDEGFAIDIRNGRHPVIETMLPVGDQYVPNDLYLDTQQQQVMVITGPNMSGKSALLRQSALIVLMAQMGSFVPASSARIGLVDRIFTRVGASDNITQGESTFMVEMLESANILNNLSPRSLILMDEIGRGTSTYDGISIAWAMVEYIHNHPKAKAKTLFATHYHELNQMEELFPRVKNYNVSVRELDRNIVFLRKLERGGTEHSFGIHVARMAGMPQTIVKRAAEILHDLEASRQAMEAGGDARSSRADVPKVRGTAPRGARQGASGHDNMQLSIFQLDDPVLKQIRDEIRGLDINSLTPLEALNKLSEIKKVLNL